MPPYARHIMRPISELTTDAAQGLWGVFTDIDDTLTTEGKLTAEAYLALWRLEAAGVRVVPVTGRPAGWCDLIAREWPVDAVIGENGALLFYEHDRALRELIHPSVADPAVRARLDDVRRDVLTHIEGSRVAKDQPYRRFDLAIDFREEAPDLGLEAAERIRAIFAAHGAHAKVSSIHVNGWFGDYDKLAMAKIAARELWDIDLEHERERFLFCGDSPNDAPMFAFFPHSCGVANVRHMVAHMTHLPAYVTQASGGAGFAQMVEVLLARRESLGS